MSEDVLLFFLPFETRKHQHPSMNEMKNAVENIHSRLGHTENSISELRDRHYKSQSQSRAKKKE